VNAERLHVIAKALEPELSGPVFQSLQQLSTAVQQAAAQPQQPAHQEQVTEHRDNLYATLDAAPSNEFGPAWQQAIKEMGNVEM
jgi:hypothetical protein